MFTVNKNSNKKVQINNVRLENSYINCIQLEIAYQQSD